MLNESKMGGVALGSAEGARSATGRAPSAAAEVKRWSAGREKEVVLRLMRESVLPSPHGRPQGVPVVHGGTITIDRHDYGGSGVSRQPESVQRGRDKFGTIETDMMQILWGQFGDSGDTKNPKNRGFC
jgi:hypothetical protein